MTVTLVTYGGSGQREIHDELWTSVQDDLIQSARQYGDVNQSIAWNRQKLQQTDFFQQNKTILDLSRGSGYWLWKPYILLDALTRAQTGDVIVYHDTGRPDRNPHQRYRFRRSIQPAIEFCRENGGFLPGVYVPHYGSNGQWTKRDCFVLMDCDSPKYWDHCQIQATYSIWESNPAVIKFVTEWLSWSQDPRILTDQDNEMGLPNRPGFTEHRHDQSVLTNMLIKYNIKCYGEKTRSIYRHRNINYLVQRIHADREYATRIPNLTALCKQYKSNKKAHNYLRSYQYWMEQRRDDLITLLEIGYLETASLQIWRDYFINGQIHALAPRDDNKEIAMVNPERIALEIVAELA